MNKLLSIINGILLVLIGIVLITTWDKTDFKICLYIFFGIVAYMTVFMFWVTHETPEVRKNLKIGFKKIDYDLDYMINNLNNTKLVIYERARYSPPLIKCDRIHFRLSYDGTYFHRGRNLILSETNKQKYDTIVKHCYRNNQIEERKD